jgi:hypothetical protein
MEASKARSTHMESVRTFIAIELSPDVLHKIGALQARIVDDLPPGLVRWVRPEGIHLTLKFARLTPPSRCPSAVWASFPTPADRAWSGSA